MNSEFGRSLFVSIAPLLLATPVQGQTLGSSPLELFKTLCVANEARIKGVETGARKVGFTPVAKPPVNTEEFAELIALARETASGRQAVVASVGETAVSKKLQIKVRARSCNVTSPASDWDVRNFAAQWVGVAPLLDAEGTVVYSYAQRPDGNVVAKDDDLPAFVAMLNAGQLRTVAVAERGPVRSLSWVVFEAPARPVIAPAVQAPPSRLSHDVDPIAPCLWKSAGRGAAAHKSLECPGESRAIAPRGFTEETPTLAKNGDIAAMLRMAHFYLSGPVVARDPAGGLAWSRRAADGGSKEGAFNIGLIHERAVGLPEDKALAAEWYRKAADLGYPEAMVNIAALQLVGSGIPKDEAAAVNWVRKAADAGSIDALFNMGQLSEAGLGVAKDPSEAIRWYRLAAEKKDTRAQYRLGVIYADGIGVTQSDSEAVRWLVESILPVQRIAIAMSDMEFLILGEKGKSAYLAKANSGDGVAALRLGLFLSNAKNPEFNPTEAIRLMTIAAEKGFPFAMSNLGLMYANGQGVPKNNAEAVRLLRAGGHQQNPDGFRTIKVFYQAP